MVPRLAAALTFAALLVGVPHAAPVLAQGGTVGRLTGVVSDTATGQPLQSVQLFLARGTTRLEARTAADGRYLFPNVPAGTYGLEVIRLGYRRVVRSNLVVGAGATLTYDLRMEAAALNLQAVVTTGVVDPTSGTRVPFSVGRVTAEDAPVPATNALETIQGKIAGVSVVPTGQAGSGTNIQLRTPTSISKSNSPLVVVDGVIQTQSFDAASADLQSMDIESVEVVKGAAAASLYGSRASAGVIQIRTRRGNNVAEGATRFTVRSEYGSNSLPRTVDWSNQHFFLADETGAYVNATGQRVPREQRVPRPAYERFQDRPYAPGTYYNQVDEFFDPGNFARNSLNIAQNGGKTNWFFSYVNSREDGVVLNSGRYDQNDFRLNLDHRPRSDLQFGVSSYYSRSKRQNLYGDTFFDLINQAPDVNLRQPDPDGTPYIFQPDFEGREENPLYVLSTERNNRNRARLQGSLEARYTPRSWLTVDGNLSYDRSDRNNDFFLDQGVKTEGYGNGGPGEISRFNGTTNALNASLSANLLKKVGDFTLRSTLRGLMESETNNTTSASGQIFATPGVNSLNNATQRFISSISETIRTNSFFLSGAADYQGKLIVDGLARRDGSSLFGPEEQENWFYRVSGAYRLSEEGWFPLKSVFSEFKVRASQGTAGGRPDFNDQYETFNFVEGGGLVKQNLGNRFLKPEFSKETEIGIDAIIKNRYSLQLSRAKQTTTDQLILIPLAGYFGYANQWQNAGTVTGNSWEGTFEAQLIRKPNFTWRAGVVADRNRNRITEFNRSCFTTNTIAFRCAGETLGNMYGFAFMRDPSQLPASVGARANEFQVNDEGLLVWVGAGNQYTDGETKRLWGTSATIGNGVYRWGQPITAVDSLGNAAVVRIGDGNPRFRYGISNTIGWRSVQLFMLWDAQVGGDVYNQTRQRMYQYGRHTDVDQAGKPQELKKTTDYYVALYAANSPTDWFVEDASFVKLRELSLKYRLPRSFNAALARLGANQASLSLIGRNLLTFTSYKGYDPEVGTVLNRFDSFDYPRYRTVTGSVEIIF
ncbi:MAG: SusC/RagA family TonB-linked outer membrane protein [Gemmatimonas sp.]|jgi:TonB-linked SusC/RagA family outer membrane protein|uniref:SusC/RagA family TonB-linked outer membrane protein n=1 Tax=Gemmatimonas sp. TaxID=1962908 RepID=UPI00391F2B1D|nr:SusC/RagA family TonB-linked outer membrane protein [Gemmatimonadota bacterium]